MRSIPGLIALFASLISALLCVPVVHAGDAAAGQPLYVVCATCHGPAGAGNQAMNSPKLTGLEPWYFVRQMELFQAGARGSAPGDMQGMQMAAMSRGPQISSTEALEDLAAYIGTFEDLAPAETVRGNVVQGKAHYAVCVACHGDRGQGIEAMAGPRLTGQNDWYVFSQIKKFKGGQRGYHEMDHGGRQMKPMVATLTDEQAIRDVVAYINTLD